MMARLLWYLDPLSPHHLKTTQINKKKMLSKLDPSEKKRTSGSVHVISPYQTHGYLNNM